MPLGERSKHCWADTFHWFFVSALDMPSHAGQWRPPESSQSTRWGMTLSPEFGWHQIILAGYQIVAAWCLVFGPHYIDLSAIQRDSIACCTKHRHKQNRLRLVRSASQAVDPTRVVCTTINHECGGGTTCTVNAFCIASEVLRE